MQSCFRWAQISALMEQPVRSERASNRPSIRFSYNDPPQMISHDELTARAARDFLARLLLAALFESGVISAVERMVRVEG